MGTDIHVAVEVRRKGVWRYFRPTDPCRWYHDVYDTQADVDTVNERMEKYAKENPRYKHVPVKLGDRRHKWDRCKTRLPEFFDGRNYLMFAILGNVRNGYGFAGVKTFDPLPSMSDNRGFPADMTPEANAKMSHEHSESWLTLAEMQTYDFDGLLVHEGVIDEVTFLECLIAQKTPESWSGSISGNGIETLTPEQYLALWGKKDGWGKEIAPKTYDPEKRYFIQYRWTVPLKTACPEIADILAYLHNAIPKGGTANDVRMIFDFDS